ncbi:MULTISPECIES: phosphotriesterase family protein [Cytobacillus]|uniref:Phosphotriesterase-related protein n=1 Tax=Cytobacillus oceanisediminis TaxID=665099 RepID=A0ABX3CJM9_9BACI|nr:MULTISPECIES: hypothetical protein [Cytobacillus]OHX40715.1 hypothetical protein BBV17_29130 [Cytobacillus oceanisediminis]
MKTGIVRTILGDVPANNLGIVYGHEHLIIQGGLETLKKRSLLINDLDKAIEEIEECKQFGASSFVDYMPLDCGRNPIALLEISKRTKTHIIATTGFHKPKFYDNIHWIYDYSIDQLIELLILECTKGMDRYSYSGPITERLSSKAGLLKCASEYNNISETSKKIFEAVALAHLETGVPIGTHTELGTCSLQQVELLQSYGVKTENIIICHMDHNPDIILHQELASTGCFIEYDNAFLLNFQTDNRFISLLETMVDSNYDKQIILGTDLAYRTQRNSYGGSPGMVSLLKDFIPKLREIGLPGNIVNNFITKNPQKAYSLSTE